MPAEVSTDSSAVDETIDTHVDSDDSHTEGEDLSAEDTGGADATTLVYAREQGWVPREEWHGDPQEWTDAKSFADRSRGINALLRKANATQRKKHDAEIAQLRKDVDNFQKGALEGLQRQLDAREAELRALRAQAITDADGAEVDRIERDLRKVETDRAELKAKEPAAATPAQIDPEQTAIAKAWVDARPWLQTDKRKARLVQLAGEEIRTDSPELIGDTQAFLNEVDRRLKADYPEMFGGTVRMRESRVDTGAPARNQRTTSKEKTYADLPKDARDTCDRMLKSGLIKKKEDYVKNFDFGAGQ